MPDSLDAAKSGSNDEPRIESYLGLRRADQIVVGALVLVMLGLAGVHWARLSGWGMQPIEIERLPEREHEFRLDINRAAWIEWVQLPDIGETLARRIAADREQNGPFATIEDLDRVHGIGPKTVERLRPWLKVSASERQEPAPSAAVTDPVE